MNVDDIIASTYLSNPNGSIKNIQYSVYDAMKRQLGDQSLQQIRIMKENQQLKQQLEIQNEQNIQLQDMCVRLQAQLAEQQKNENDIVEDLNRRIQDLLQENMQLKVKNRELETQQQRDMHYKETQLKQIERLEAELVKKDQEQSYELQQTRQKVQQLSAQNDILSKDNLDKQFKISDYIKQKQNLLDSTYHRHEFLQKSQTQHLIDAQLANFHSIVNSNDYQKINTNDLRERQRQLERFHID